MKYPMKTLQTGVLAVFLLLTTGAVFAFGNGPDKRSSDQRGSNRMQTMPMVDKAVRAFHRLDLDDAQKDSVHAAMSEMKSDVRPIMQEMKSGYKQLATLVKADVYDEDAVAKIATKEGELAAEKMLIASRVLSQMYAILSEEQRAELEEMTTHRRQNRGEKHKQRTRED